MNFTMFGETFSPISFPSSISLIKHFLPSSPAVATTKVYINGDTFWLIHLFHVSSSQKESGRATNPASSYYHLDDNFRSLQIAQLTPPPPPPLTHAIPVTFYSTCWKQELLQDHGNARITFTAQLVDYLLCFSSPPSPHPCLLFLFSRA